MAEIGAREGDEFKAICTAPSINKTPVGSAMVPVAYPVLHDLGNSVDLSKTTRFNGKAAYLFDKSKQTSTTGDEPGVGKGVRSNTVDGEVKPIEGSKSFRIEGKPVVRAMDKCTLNGGNCEGIFVTVAAPNGAIVGGKPTRDTDPPKQLTPEQKKRWYEKTWDAVKDAGVWAKNEATTAANEVGAAATHPIDAVKGFGKDLVNTVWNRCNERIDGKYIGGNRHRPRDEWEIQRDTHMAMITEAEAEKVLSLRQSRRHKQSRSRQSRYLMTSLLVCTCGARLEGDSGYYRCSMRCGAARLAATHLDEAVTKTVMNELLRSDFLQSLRKEVERLLAAHRRTTPGLADEYERRLKELDRELVELVRAISQIKHQRPILDRIDAVEVKRNEVANKLSGMHMEAETKTMVPVTEQALRAFVESLRDDLQLGDLERRKALLKQLIEKAVLSDGFLDLYPNTDFFCGVKVASPLVIKLNPRSSAWPSNDRYEQFTLRRPDEHEWEIAFKSGLTQRYQRPREDWLLLPLADIRDRNSNRITFQYPALPDDPFEPWRPECTVDSVGRRLQLTWSPRGRLTEIVCFTDAQPHSQDQHTPRSKPNHPFGHITSHCFK